MISVTLPYLLRRCAAKFPAKEAIVSDEGRWTFDAWDRNSNQRAHALASLGIKKGDHVATLFLNGRDVLETYLALLKLGAVLVPLNVRMTPAELEYLVEHSQSGHVIHGPKFKGVIETIKGNLPQVKAWIGCGGPAGPDPDLNRLMLEQNDDDLVVDLAEEDMACILYTAGTTGKPKGVMLSHRNCLWAAINLAQDSTFSRHYRVLLVFPLFHAAAFSLVNVSLYMGCTLVCMAEFNPKAVMELMVTEGISKMAFPPTVWNFILQLPDLDQYDTSSVESISSGAEVMPIETKHKLMRLFPRAKLGETYGMTETVATITTLDPRYVTEKTACVGQAFTNMEIRVVDDADHTLPVGQVGEVVARGPNVMQGYFRNPAETEQTLRGGWLHTGDLGRLDDDGFLYLVDRKKEMIISGGENVYPREVEEVLYTHPDISEAAVIGLADPTWGERVHAVVSVKAGRVLTEEDVIDFCAQRLAGYKKPKSVAFMAKLPRSPAGKVLKRLLREKRP
jgi:fatty-acyl-CoA synthase